MLKIVDAMYDEMYGNIGERGAGSSLCSCACNCSCHCNCRCFRPDGDFEW
ncbi:hypothetical protein [Enorma phocaeensis]